MQRSANKQKIRFHSQVGTNSGVNKFKFLNNTGKTSVVRVLVLCVYACVCYVCVCDCVMPLICCMELANRLRWSSFCQALKRVVSVVSLSLSLSLLVSFSLLPLVCGLLSMCIIPLSHCDSSRLRHSGCQCMRKTLPGSSILSDAPKSMLHFFWVSLNRQQRLFRLN